MVAFLQHMPIVIFSYLFHYINFLFSLLQLLVFSIIFTPVQFCIDLTVSFFLYFFILHNLYTRFSPYMVFLDNFVYNLFLSDLHHLYRSEYTYGIKLLFLTDFVFICDSTFQCFILWRLYNVNCVNYVYHVSSAINSILFKFGVRKKTAFTPPMPL